MIIKSIYKQKLWRSEDLLKLRKKYLRNIMRFRIAYNVTEGYDSDENSLEFWPLLKNSMRDVKSLREIYLGNHTGTSFVNPSALKQFRRIIGQARHLRSFYCLNNTEEKFSPKYISMLPEIKNQTHLHTLGYYIEEDYIDSKSAAVLFKPMSGLINLRTLNLSIVEPTEEKLFEIFLQI